jgi:hypothetical protein
MLPPMVHPRVPFNRPAFSRSESSSSLSSLSDDEDMYSLDNQPPNNN